MREIKFRAWDNRKKEWLLGYEMPNLGGFSLFGEVVMLGEWSGVLDTFLFERDGYKATDLKVMQYTGLKDKNGVEIYEGDIVSFGGKWRGIIEFGRFTVSNGDDLDYTIGFCVREIYAQGNAIYPSVLSWDADESIMYKVIGNIYENPELLEGKD